MAKVPAGHGASVPRTMENAIQPAVYGAWMMIVRVSASNGVSL